MKKSILLALALGVCTSAWADDAQKVLECMRGNVPSSLRVQDIELTSTDRSEGSRSLRGKLFAVRETQKDLSHVRVMLQVNAPENLAGSAFLLREATKVSEQGMYLYLPSVRRVRRRSHDTRDDGGQDERKGTTDHADAPVSRRSRPVISRGCSTPSIARTVGPMSQSAPPARSGVAAPSSTSR